MSRQTVKNRIGETGRLQKAAPAEPKKAEELHIFADEDHVHMQPKGSRMVPLITVTEGTRQIGKNRRETVGAVHFTGKMGSTRELWEQVDGYIHEAYDQEVLKRVCIHGGGGRWISSGEEIVGNSCSVMDGYHLWKRVRSFSRKFPNKNAGQRLKKAIRENDRKRADAVLHRLYEEEPREAVKEDIKEFGRYLLGNWESIVRRCEEGMQGSCTEAQISHVLSERLSRSPMGWSEKGLEKMAELRAYRKNGCEVKGSDFRRAPEEKERNRLQEYAREMLAEAVEGCTDWSIFEPQPPIFASQTGTRILLDSFGRQRSILN